MIYVEPISGRLEFTWENNSVYVPPSVHALIFSWHNIKKPSEGKSVYSGGILVTYVYSGARPAEVH